jgi:CheY-like chemotaxis protein
MPEDRQRILVVDDNPWIRQLLSDVLGGEGYQVQMAENGAEAIERLRQGSSDLVLLDVIMPGIDGWGVLDHIAKMSAPPRVVVVSGLDEIVPPGHLQPCVAGSLTKPFDVDRLLTLCRKVLEVPPVIPAGGARREPRQTFVVETTLLSDGGMPLALSQITQLSHGGFRVELQIPLVAGDGIRVAFRWPGREEPLVLNGRVRWRDSNALGAEIETVSDDEAKLLRQLLGNPEKA